MVLNARATLARNPRCVILAATIHHDPLVTERQGLKAVRDLGRLVPGDDNGGQPRHHILLSTTEWASHIPSNHASAADLTLSRVTTVSDEQRPGTDAVYRPA